MTILIDGKKFLEDTKLEIRNEIERLQIQPSLAAVIVGQNPSSKTYVGLKVKDCKDVGFNSVRIDLPENTAEEELFEKIYILNNDQKIDGILIQSPLPSASME